MWNVRPSGVAAVRQVTKVTQCICKQEVLRTTGTIAMAMAFLMVKWCLKVWKVRAI